MDTLILDPDYKSRPGYSAPDGSEFTASRPEMFQGVTI